MARPRAFDMDETLDALCDVFWEHGFEGTSYAQIMAATGLQKGSLYAAFGDKRALYLAALAHYDTGYVAADLALLRNNTLSGFERIDTLLQNLVDAAQTRRGLWGCFLCNAAIDQAPCDKATKTQVSRSLNQVKSAIATALDGTQARDKVELIWALYLGGRTIIKSGADKTVLKALKTQTLSLL